MSVKIDYNELPKRYIQNKHIDPNKLMPTHPHRTCVSGASNTGKNNILMNIINEYKNLYKIYLYAKKIDEPLYQCFINNWTRHGDSMGFEILEFSNDINRIVDLNSINQRIQNLIVFDGMVSEKNSDKVSKVFIRGRQSNCSIIFISQSYFGIPNQGRINSDYFIFRRNMKGNKLIQVAKDYGGFFYFIYR